MREGMNWLLIGITLWAYMFARVIARKYPSPLTTPVFVATVLIIGIFGWFDISYEQYGTAKDRITSFLGPATVALAVPLYKNRETLLKYAVPALAGLVAGTVTTVGVIVGMLKGFHLSEEIIVSLSVKSVTTPIAVEIVRLMHGDPALTAVFVVFTGMVGAMFGQWLLSRFGVYHPLSRGLALGAIAHGIGTAQIATEGEVQAAVSSIAMGISAVLTSFLAPIALPYFLK